MAMTELDHATVAEAAASMAGVVSSVIPGVVATRVRALPHAGGFRLGLEGERGEAELCVRGSTLWAEHLSMLLPPGRDEDDDRLDPRLPPLARALLDRMGPRGCARLVLTSHWSREHEVWGWVRAGALPSMGGGWAMAEGIRFNLDALGKGLGENQAALDLARRLGWRLGGEPHLIRALAAMPEPVRRRWGPTLGHAALKGATWPVEVDLADPSTATAFAAACGEVSMAMGRQAYRDSGSEAMVSEGFTPEDVGMVWSR